MRWRIVIGDHVSKSRIEQRVQHVFRKQIDSPMPNIFQYASSVWIFLPGSNLIIPGHGPLGKGKGKMSVKARWWTGDVVDKKHGMCWESHEIHSKYHTKPSPGWWFGTFFLFPYIGNNHPNWLIFFRGVQNTKPRHSLNMFLHSRQCQCSSLGSGTGVDSFEAPLDCTFFSPYFRLNLWYCSGWVPYHLLWQGHTDSYSCIITVDDSGVPTLASSVSSCIIIARHPSRLYESNVLSPQSLKPHEQQWWKKMMRTIQKPKKTIKRTTVSSFKMFQSTRHHSAITKMIQASEFIKVSRANPESITTAKSGNQRQLSSDMASLGWFPKFASNMCAIWMGKPGEKPCFFFLLA